MLTKNYPQGVFWLTGMKLTCATYGGKNVSSNVFSDYQTHSWHAEHLKEFFSSLRSSKKHPDFNKAVNITVRLMLLQSPSAAEKTPLHLCCSSTGGMMSHWWIICLLISEWHSGVWIEGLLSCFSIRGGCQEERHKGGLLFGHRAQASCHCTGAWRHIRVCHRFYLKHGRDPSLVTFQMA